MFIKGMDNTMKVIFRVIDDPAKNTVILTGNRDGSPRFVFTYTRPDDTHLTLEGRLRDDSIRARLRKIDTSKFLLINRGFHWINEFPFNR